MHALGDSQCARTNSPIRSVLTPVNHIFPSGPEAIPSGSMLSTARVSSIAPAVVIRPSRLPANSLNQSAPAEAVVMFIGVPPCGSGKSVITPPVVIRPIFWSNPVVNHRFPSGPAVIEPASPAPLNVVSVPVVVIRPITPFPGSVNQSAPSDPVVIPDGDEPAGKGNSVILPVVVMRPIASPGSPSPGLTVNHSAPSGPAVMPAASVPATGRVNWRMCPLAGLIAPIRPSDSVNHIRPSGPAVMSKGKVLPATGNSVIAPAVVIRPILLALNSVNHSAPSGPTAIRRGSLFAVGMENSLKCPAIDPAHAGEAAKAKVMAVSDATTSKRRDIAPPSSGPGVRSGRSG